MAAGDDMPGLHAWSLNALLDGLAARGDGAAVLTVRDETVAARSGADIADAAGRLASGLLAEGVEKGEPVLLIAPNGPDWVVARLAIAAAGALAVPLDDLSTADEIAAVLGDCGARRAFASPSHRDALAAADGALSIHILAGPADAPPAADGRDWRRLFADRPGPLPVLSPADPAVRVYTSGTTGAPKSFVLAYANLAANVDAILAEGVVGPADRVLLPLPLHHVYPFLVGMLVTLSSGATIVFPEAVAGPQILRALSAAKVTVIVGVPRLYAAVLAGIEGRIAAAGALPRRAFAGLLALSAWLRRRWRLKIGRRLFAGLHRRLGPDLRLLVSGGAPLGADLVARLDGLGWDVLSGYGLAETASIFTGNLPGHKRIGSEGQALAGGEIRIADADADGIGEIQLRGASVFAGYAGDKPPASEVFADGGWFRTGDLGRLDGDGYLYVTGRAKEMIVLGGGKNVFPEDLEKIYGASPFVEEIAVLERDGVLVALVRPEIEAIRAAGYSRIEDALRVALAEAARTRPAYQRLSGFAVARAPLPQTRLGKYRRFLLPGLYAQAQRGAAAPAGEPSAEDRALLAASPARELWALLRDRYPRAALSLETMPQLDLGMDSLGWVEFSLTVEARLGRRLDEAAIARIVTLRDLVREVNAAPVSTATPSPADIGALTPAQARRIAPPGPALSLFGAAVHGVNRLLARTYFRLRVEGLENLPATGPILLAANHASDLDSPVLAAALPATVARRLHWGGDAGRLFAWGWSAALLRGLRVFPVDESAPATTLAYAEAVLRRGDRLVWFPESWRTPDGALQSFLPGVGMMLDRTGVPVLPVHIAGTFESQPRWRRWPRPGRLRVRLGAPLDPRDLERRGAGDSAAERIAAALRDAVAALADG